MEAYGSDDANSNNNISIDNTATHVMAVRAQEKKRNKQPTKKQLFLGARLNLNILTSAAVEVHFMLSTRQYAIKCIRSTYSNRHANIRCVSC